MAERWPFAPIEGVLVARLGVPPRDRKSHGSGGDTPQHERDGLGATPVNMARYLGCSRDSIFQYRKRDLSEVVADRLAAALGIAPVTLWPTWYDRDLVGVDDLELVG